MSNSMQDSNGNEWSKKSPYWSATAKLLDLIANFLKSGTVWDADGDDAEFPDFLSRMRSKGIVKNDGDNK